MKEGFVNTKTFYYIVHVCLIVFNFSAGEFSDIDNFLYTTVSI